MFINSLDYFVCCIKFWNTNSRMILSPDSSNHMAPDTNSHHPDLVFDVPSSHREPALNLGTHFYLITSELFSIYIFEIYDVFFTFNFLKAISNIICNSTWKREYRHFILFNNSSCL